MNCPKCQAAIPTRAGVQFCRNCGFQITEQAPTWLASPEPTADAHQRVTRVNMNATPHAPAVPTPHAFSPHDTHYDPAPPLPSVVDHDDYQIEIEPSMPPQHLPAAATPGDPSSAALLSLLNRARAQTGEQPITPATPSPSRSANNANTKKPPQAQPTLVDEDLDLSAEADDNADDDFIIDEDSIEMGEVEGLNSAQREPDAFGEEDSGPVPMSAPRLRPARNPRRGSNTRTSPRSNTKDNTRARRASSASSAEGGALGSIKRLSATGKQLINRIPPRVMAGAVAALMLSGVLYVFFGGDTPQPTPDTSASGMAAAQNPQSNANAPTAPAAPDMELIPLDGSADPDAPTASETPNHPLFPRSVLAHTAKPLSTKQTKMGRVCVLREGPSSRFKAIVNQTPSGAKVTVLAESEGNWSITTHSGLTGWSKSPCTNSQPSCDLRQGPGDQFKTVSSPADTLKVNGPVKSSERWRYVKYEDFYGWMGPACWK